MIREKVRFSLYLPSGISASQVVFCIIKQDLKIRKCSDKITSLRTDKSHLGCGVSSRALNMIRGFLSDY